MNVVFARDEVQVLLILLAGVKLQPIAVNRTSV